MFVKRLIYGIVLPIVLMDVHLNASPLAMLYTTGAVGVECLVWSFSKFY